MIEDNRHIVLPTDLLNLGMRLSDLNKNQLKSILIYLMRMYAGQGSEMFDMCHEARQIVEALENDTFPGAKTLAGSVEADSHLLRQFIDTGADMAVHCVELIDIWFDHWENDKGPASTTTIESIFNERREYQSKQLKGRTAARVINAAMRLAGFKNTCTHFKGKVARGWILPNQEKDVFTKVNCKQILQDNLGREL